MEKVMAQGTFDVLHPGHLHYLRESADLGDELVVVVARKTHTDKDLVFSPGERKEMLEALEIVDRAVKGSEDDIYSTVEEIDPDVITLGYDQDHEPEEVREMAEKATGHEVEVERVSGRGEYSSSEIKDA